MATTVALQFPLGRYHGTPWNRAVNEGEIEWPPSPWRILRALIATWRTRWPELPEHAFDALLRPLLLVQPHYRTPSVDPAHTRHYMPDLAHRSGAPSTDLVLDPFLWLAGDRTVLVNWDVDLDAEQRRTLARLCALIPYVGRSESIVRAALLDPGEEPDGTWWAPDDHAVTPVRLLVPEPDSRLSDLEVTTVHVRKARLSLPPSTRLVAYAPPFAEPPRVGRASGVPSIGAIRWQLTSRGPFQTEFGILATDELRRTRLLQASRQLGVLPPQLSGKDDRGDAGERAPLGRQHAHAHWLWIPKDKVVNELALWMPHGDLDAELAGAMLGRPSLGRELTKGQGYTPRGFKASEVYVVALGRADAVLNDLVGPAHAWTSKTPYLPVRHRKRNQTAVDWLAADLARECDYRGLPQPLAIRVLDTPESALRGYRRYRWDERMDRARHGAVEVAVDFGEPVAGPLCLGALSHFGFGLFEPSEQ